MRHVRRLLFLARQKSTDNYYVMSKLVPQLKLGEDYTIDEKQKTVAPTEAGVSKMEKCLRSITFMIQIIWN